MKIINKSNVVYIELGSSVVPVKKDLYEPILYNGKIVLKPREHSSAFSEITIKSLSDIEYPISNEVNGELISRPADIATLFEHIYGFFFESEELTAAAEPSLDAFGRQRISNPLTLFASKQLHDNSPLFFDEEKTGTSVWGSSQTLMSTSADGQYVVRQSKQRMDYQAGKSQKILCTFTAPQEANVVKRIGYFSSSTSAPFTSNLDGIFVQVEEDDIYFCVYNNGVELEKVGQADWNLNGVPSLDMSKSQILIMDFSWLGVGGVRFGWSIDGKIVYAHRYNHSNRQVGVYMQSPNKPVRYEIRQSGVGSGSLAHICSEVESEGGQEDIGFPRRATTGQDHLDLSSITVLYPVLGVRLKSTHLDTTVKFKKLSVTSETNDSFRVVLLFNPTLSGVLAFAPLANSACEYAKGDGSVSVSSEGLGMYEDFASSNIQSTSGDIDSSIRLGSNIDGTPDEVWLCVMPLSSNADINASFNWIEL